MRIGLLFLQVTLIVGLGRLVGLVMAAVAAAAGDRRNDRGDYARAFAFGVGVSGVYGELFPAASWPLLEALSQVGVVFFLFLVGWNLIRD